MSSAPQPLDLAIVGMACRFPGAGDLFAFWENVLANRSTGSYDAVAPKNPSTLRQDEPEFSPVLDAARSALADAGLSDRMPDRRRVAVVFGCDGQRSGLHLDSYDVRFVDDPGGSAFVALKLGARALIDGRADLALAGGVRDDGAVPGVVVLKRLRDAERDGDRIYAVLKGLGLATSDDGGDPRAIRRAYRRSGVAPGTVGYLEANGSDVRAEARAIRGAFPTSCVFGMFSESMAGLIKAALCLHHRMIPESPKAERFARRSGLTQNPVSRPWITSDSSLRRAGVLARGFAGKVGHAVLEDHPRSADGVTSGAMLRWPSEAILLAAEDRAALSARVRRLVERLRTRPEIDLKDLAATLAGEALRPDRTWRLGLVAESIDDLVARLDALVPRLDDPSCKSIRDGRGTYFWESPAGREGGLAFLFPGEGSQYPGMLADLCPHFPEVRALFDSSDRLARESGAIKPPSTMLFGGAGEGDASLWEPSTAVNLVLSSQWALYTLLRKLGLRPAAVVGHSSGEFLALAAAGALRVDRGLEERFNALAVVFARLGATGGLASRLVSVATSRERVEDAIGDLSEAVTVAVDNCPHQVVLAGLGEAVDTVIARLRSRGVLTEDLPFARAYHTPAFAPAIGPIRDFFETLEIARLATPLYSCCSSGLFPDDAAAIRRLAVDQWTRPVEFRRTIEAMHADGLRVFVDVGARGNLAGFVEDTLRGRPSFAIAANLPRRSGLTQMNHLIASLFAQGLEMTPEFLFARRRPKQLSLDPPRPTPEIPPSAGFSEMQASAELVPPSSNRPEEIESLASADEVMQSYFATMNEFLRTQSAVMEGFLAGKVEDRGNPVPSALAPEAALGPWSGEVRRLDPGRAVEVVITLDAAGDPVAEHHTFGGRRISAVDPDMKGLPVLPFTVMAEMLAQVAARLVPGRILIGLREIKARRWVRYEAGPIPLEVVAEIDPDNPGEIRASLYNRGKSGLGDAPEVEGVIIFGERRDEPPVSTAQSLASPGPSRFNARSMYAEQWLFHGPALRAVSEVGLIDDGGIDGTLRVLPRLGLYQDRNAPRPLTDPIVLDAFTHLLGLWGLDRLSEGDVVFPLRLGRLEIFGDDPPEGTDCPCRVRIRSVERLKVTADAEILRPDGTLWMRLTDWDDWRFYWPSRYRDVFRLPEHVLLGEPLDLPGIEPGDAVAVWLQPPGDMGRPVWRDVLEQCQLSPDERSGPLRPEGHEGRRTLRLWGRIAAKEAARRLWLDAGDPPVFPADLSILPDPHGRPVLRPRREPGREDTPAVSIAHTEGAAVAIASRDPHARIGIDVEKVTERSPSFESAAFSTGERALLDLKGGDRAEWIARIWCAKEAAAKATGFALIAGPSSVEATSADAGGAIGVRIGPELAARCPDLGSGPILVHTQRKDDYLWAWTYQKVTEAAEGEHAGFCPQYSEADA